MLCPIKMGVGTSGKVGMWVYYRTLTKYLYKFFRFEVRAGLGKGWGKLVVLVQDACPEEVVRNGREVFMFR